MGKKTISSKSLKADLSEYFTGTPLTEEKTDAIAWLNKNYWWPVWGSILLIGAVVAIFWKSLKEWCNGPSEEEGVTETEKETEEEDEKE